MLNVRSMDLLVASSEVNNCTNTANTVAFDEVPHSTSSYSSCVGWAKCLLNETNSSLDITLSLLCRPVPPWEDMPPFSYAAPYRHNEINSSPYLWKGYLCSLLFVNYLSSIGQS